MTTPNGPDDADSPDSPDSADDMEPQNTPDTSDHQHTSDTSESRDSSGSPESPETPEPPDTAHLDRSRPGPPPAVPPDGGVPDEEEALRTLMRDAVRGIRASPDALDHLRRAVPARQQHRRQALAGTAAAVLLAGMAVPALLRATDTTSSAGAAPENVASSHAPAPGEDGHTGAWDGSGGPFGRASTEPGSGHRQHPPSGGTAGPSTAPASPSGSSVPVVPDCSSTQLGQGASQAGDPDAGGRVYGWFRLANVSPDPCTVPGGGLVRAVAQGSADPSRIQVVDHSAGDPAVGLPPADPYGPIVLEPGDNYEVAFAWVPAADGPGGCAPPSSPATSPSPTATATDPAGAGSAPDDGTGTNLPRTQTGGDTPASATPGSVTLNHTPAAGAPEVDGPVIQDACAGTVYTTTPIPAPASADPPAT